MALRSLAGKMRIPASAAPRLLSAPRVSPASGSRALHLSSSSSAPSTTTPTRTPSIQIAEEWYLLQRERYDDVTRELATLRRVVRWTEKLELFFRWVYVFGAPLATAVVALEWKEYQEAGNVRK